MRGLRRAERETNSSQTMQCIGHSAVTCIHAERPDVACEQRQACRSWSRKRSSTDDLDRVSNRGSGRAKYCPTTACIADTSNGKRSEGYRRQERELSSRIVNGHLSARTHTHAHTRTHTHTHSIYVPYAEISKHMPEQRAILAYTWRMSAYY